MILKTLSKRAGGTANIVNYLLAEKHILSLDKGKPMLITKNLRGQSVAQLIKEIDEHEKGRLHKRVNSVSLYHNVIAFHPKSGKYISEKIIKEIVDKFIELRGENCQHLAIPHFEKHFHVHILTSGTDASGKASRQSKAAYHEMTVKLETYIKDKFPELSDSNINHQKRTERIPIVEKIKNARTPVISKLNGILASLYKEAHSIQEFKERIEQTGYNIYNRDGRMQGLVVDGYKYRLSTLGYDRFTISALNEFKNVEANIIDELTSLRAAANESREVDKEDELEREAKYKSEDVDEELDEDEYNLTDSNSEDEY